MALIAPGPLAALASGKIGGTVFSRNRGGAYVRNWAIPSTVTSARAQLVKYIFGALSQAFASLHPEERVAWDRYAMENPVINRIGQQVTLKGRSIFVGCNSRLHLAGDTGINAPPVLPAPLAAPVSAPAVDLNGDVATITHTEHPDKANIRFVVYGAVTTSGAREYVENLFTHIYTSAKNLDAGDLDIWDELEAALGVPQVGLTYHFKVVCLDSRTGLISAAQYLSTKAVDTTP